MIPVIAPPDIAIKPVRIGAKGVRLIVALYVPGDGVAQQSTEYGAARDSAAIAVADSRTGEATGGTAEDGAGRDIADTAVLLILALAIVVRGLVVARAGAILLLAPPLRPHFVILSVLIV